MRSQRNISLFHLDFFLGRWKSLLNVFILAFYKLLPFVFLILVHKTPVYSLITVEITIRSAKFQPEMYDMLTAG